MTEHAPCITAGGRENARTGPKPPRILDTYDASPLVGLRTVVYGATIEHVGAGGEVSIELPKLESLLATVAIIRCLMPIRLLGREMKACRKIMGMTVAELADQLGERTAPETVSRWESETQPMGGYAEKVLRLLICESLREKAPGVSYDASMISHLRVTDPWRSNPDYEVPAIEVSLVRVKEPSTGMTIDAYDKAA